MFKGTKALLGRNKSKVQNLDGSQKPLIFYD